MIIDKLIYALNNLRIRALRSVLTALGIAIAVATVTALVALGLGLQVGINEQFEQLGGNKIFIQGQGFSPDTSDVLAFTRDDAEFIERIVGVDLAYGLYYEGVEVRYDDQLTFQYGFGMPGGEYYDFTKEAFQLDVIEGRLVRDDDSRKVTLGYSYSQPNKIFDDPVLLRDNIEINGVTFQVIGFVDELGNPQDDGNAYVSEDDLRDIFDEDEKISFVFAEISNPDEADKVAERIERRLRSRLDQDEGEETFFVQTADQLIESFSNVINILVGFIISVGLISLVVGAINITNTMYTAVLERTREIGTIKAIGGKNSDIQTIFLIESALIGIGGGVTGTVIGYIVAFLGASVVGAAGFGILKFYFPFWLWVLGIGFAVIMALISGYLPSRQASRLKPVESLRYE